jgi:hypothetical protein
VHFAHFHSHQPIKSDDYDSIFGSSPLASILLIAGPASHGWDEHEYPSGVELLANCLRQAQPDLQVVHRVGFPQAEDTDGSYNWDAVVLYSDGEAAHVALHSTELLQTWRERGAGMVVLHFALEPPAPEHPVAHFLSNSVGGYFETDWSVNAVWQMQEPELPEHPVSQGVSPLPPAG